MENVKARMSNGKFDPKYFWGPWGPNEKAITPEEDEEKAMGISNISYASYFAQAQHISQLHMTLVFETPYSNDSVSSSDILKATWFFGKIFPIYDNWIANKKTKELKQAYQKKIYQAQQQTRKNHWIDGVSERAVMMLRFWTM